VSILRLIETLLKVARNDPDVLDSDQLRRRIAELEQVVRELRQRQPRSGPLGVAPLITADSEDDHSPQGSGRRRVILDRFTKVKLDEMTMAEYAPAIYDVSYSRRAEGKSNSHEEDPQKTAFSDSFSPPTPSSSKTSYGAEPYSSNLLPGEELVHDKMGRRIFLGAPAGMSMMRRVSFAIWALLMISCARSYRQRPASMTSSSTCPTIKLSLACFPTCKRPFRSPQSGVMATSWARS